MRIISLLILWGLSTITIIQAQTFSPSVISTDGGFGKTSTLTFDWTLGELAVKSVYTPNTLFTEGFHQPILIVTEVDPKTNLSENDYLIEVAPNPVQSLLSIRIEFKQDQKIHIYLTDLLGRILISQNVNSETESVDMDVGELPSALYILWFTNSDGAPIKSFKISKIQ